jgi:hypothetical protein
MDMDPCLHGGLSFPDRNYCLYSRGRTVKGKLSIRNLVQVAKIATPRSLTRITPVDQEALAVNIFTTPHTVRRSAPTARHTLDPMNR